MFFRIDDENLLEKYKTILNKIEDLKSIKLNALPVLPTNFRGIHVQEDYIECKYFTVISIGSLLVFESEYYLQVYPDNCAYKTGNKQRKNYLDVNLFGD